MSGRGQAVVYSGSGASSPGQDARGPGEGLTAAVVGETFGQAEDRALDGQRPDQLRPGEFAVLGTRWLFVVDQAPEPFEDLLAEDAGEQADDDADRGEDDLHARLPSRRAAILLAAMGVSFG